jgi:16S rRNA (adenine1518-N6/adenine1519-N6)-dimethyltransferase
MDRVKAKKHLGQHFLKDLSIASQTAAAVTGHMGARHLVEIGPGMGVLTDFLIKMDKKPLTLIELDQESVHYLSKKYQEAALSIRHEDFLKVDFESLQPHPLSIVGNFPYNISSQLFFKILDHRDQVTEIVGMLQKEVAQRLAAPKGSRTYGILSVFLQAFYEVEYLFEVPPEVFAPPPKVTSAVIRAKRNQVQTLECDEALFRRVVKQAFSMRRKTLRNALKPLGLDETLKADEQLDLRAERLGVDDFVLLTNKIQASWNR